MKPEDLGPNARASATGPAASPASQAASGRIAAPSAGADIDDGAIYGALDLGTNNCRLLLARPSRRGFRVVDAFSRIIRLGEGVSQSGALSELAMSRTIDALKICAGKLDRHGVARARMVATQACRVAVNGPAFITRVRESDDCHRVMEWIADAHQTATGVTTVYHRREDDLLTQVRDVLRS